MSSRSASSFLVVLVLSFVPAPAHAQDGGDGGDGGEVTLEDFQKSVDELGRKLERQAIEFETTGAYIGGMEPWPRPDPVHDVQAWSAAVLGAERLTAAQVLERSGKVALRVAKNPPLARGYADDRDLIGAVVEGVIEAGLRTDPDSLLQLHVTLAQGSTTYDFGMGGRSTGSATGHFLQVIASFRLPARILRAGAVHHVPLQLEHVVRVRSWPVAPDRQVVHEVLVGTVRKLLDRTRAGATGAPSGAGAWPAWIGDGATAAQRFEQWQASFRKRRKITPALGAIPGFGQLEVWHEYYRPLWRSRLAAAGFTTGLSGAPDLKTEQFQDPHRSGDRLDGGGVVTARVSVKERDAVAVLGGGYVRVKGASFVDVTFPRLGTPSGLAALGEEVQERSVSEFLAELGTGGGRAGQGRHPNADLVAKFLRTRQRTPLPDHVVDEVSNKVAMALAGATDIPPGWIQKWTLGEGRDAVLYLPRVGDARRAELVPSNVQQAVRRVLADLNLADPLGLYAFDQPFHFDGSRGYKDTLPDDFVDLLSDRPSGAGALERVYVDTADSAAWDLADSYGQKAGYKLVQGSLRSIFEGQRILVCQYIPADGDVNWSTSRYFWYGAEPDGWTELVKTLPAEIRLDQIGPARKLPPKYVSEADALLAR